MRPAPGLNEAQMKAFLAKSKAFYNRPRPKGPAPSGGGFFDKVSSFMKNNPNMGSPNNPIGPKKPMGPRRPDPPNKISDPVRNPRDRGGPRGGGAMGAMGPKPIGGGPFGTKNPNGPRKPMGSPSPMSGGIMGGMNSLFKGPIARKKGGMATKKMRDGGMTARKGYAEGGMPMVMKGGKKVPSFAADGKGKMAMGGMAQALTIPKPKAPSTRVNPARPPMPGMPRQPVVKAPRPRNPMPPRPKVVKGPKPGMPDPRAAMKHGGMAHGKAPKGRGMAIMIAIGKPKGRGKS